MTDLICHCFQVREAELRQILAAHSLTTVTELQQHTHAGRGCGCCRFDLEELITACRHSAADNKDIAPIT